MLKDDLKEIKREMPDGLEIQTGACSFCGQMGQIETLIPWDQEKVNEAVTEQKNTPEKKDRKNVRAKQSRSSSGSRRIQKRQMNQ